MTRNFAWSRLRAVPAALLVLALVPARAPAAEAAAASALKTREILEDEWMIVRIAGQPAGRVHTTVVREGDLITTTAYTLLQLERLGVPIRQEVTQTFRETDAGTPLGFTMSQKVAAHGVEVEGTFEGSKLHLVSRTMGQERTRTEDWPEGALFGYAMERFVRAQSKEPGTRFSFRTYSAELDRFIDVTYEVVDEQEIEVLGRKVRATRSRIHGVYPGITPVEWRDADGVVWKMEMGMLGLKIDMLRASREVAEGKTRRPARFDVLIRLCVQVDSPIARPREVRSALYRLRLKGGSMKDFPLDGAGQKVERVEKDGSVLLRVESVRPDPERVLPHPIRDPDMKKCLDPSTFVQSDDAEIVRVAREVASEVRSSYAAAKRLELWVFRNITDRGFDRGFASAKEVMQDRAGDCTEHAVLLTALLRAAKIPARTAAGLLYVELPATGSAFAYHMWTEAYVGDWVPLDATLAGSAVDATHIRLAESDLSGMSPVAGMDGLFQVFGRLEIDIVEYAVGERVVRPGEKGPRGGIETRYRDLDYGISFAVPEGWRVLRAGDPGIVEKGAIACLVRRGGKERIALIALDVAPGTILSEVVDRLSARHHVKKRKATRLGGLPALRLEYEKGGRLREGVAAKREGTMYLLRLEPATLAGSEALTETAASFRFE